MQIIDITGRIVYSTNLKDMESASPGLNEQNISVSNLDNGIYYWEVISNKGIEGKGKIAVIK